MWKLFIGSFLSGFINEVMSAKVGDSILKGKVTLTKYDVETKTATTLVDLGSGYKYEITVKRV